MYTPPDSISHIFMTQEILGVEPKWFEAGAKPYWLNLYSLTALEFLLFGALELKRYQGWKEHKEVGAHRR